MTLAAAGLALLALCALLGATGRRGWPFELFLSVAPQQGATCALYAGLMAVCHLPALSAGALALAALNLWTARELFSPAPAPVSSATLRIVWANVWGKEDALERVFALAEREGADAVAIGEFPPCIDSARRAAIAGKFVHQAGAMHNDAINVALFSALPAREAAALAIPELPRRASLSVLLAGLRLIAIHPLVPYTPAMNAKRDAMLAAAFGAARAGGPALIVGDCNTVSWSAYLRGLIRIHGAQHAAWGSRSTWVTTQPVLGLPIDHAFVFGGARASTRTGPFVGSDHYPVIVDVLLPA